MDGKPWDPREAFKCLVLAGSFAPSLAETASGLRPSDEPPWFEMLAREAASSLER